ncbi:MAG: TolC family protein [Armatimonadota bacterium]|jgi:cobalt-zinc-cadmium efflux system outer membrane protein
MMRTSLILTLLTATILLAPIADAADRREALSAESQSRVDAAPAWGDADEAPIAAMLADGLTRDEAVQIALANNSALQAAFAELGVADAELRQAGLYSNPSIETVIRWPDEHDAEVEIEATWNLADLWRVPLRKRVAWTQADRATMTVLAELLNTAADARLAWDGAVAATALVAETEQVFDAARALLARMEERFDYGFGEQLDIARIRAEVAEVEFSLAMAEAERGVAMARLRRVLGLPVEAVIEPEGDLPEAPVGLPGRDELIALALAERPEVHAADLGARAADLDLRLERRSAWRRVGLGPAYARESGGDELWGVVLDVGLPVADSNRAQRLRARAELRAAENRAAAARAMVGEEVEVALERLLLATRKEALVRETIIPARERAHQFAQTHYMQMELSMLPVIETRRELAEARRMHVEARRQVAEALVELQFGVGGRLP